SSGIGIHRFPEKSPPAEVDRHAVSGRNGSGQPPGFRSSAGLKPCEPLRRLAIRDSSGETVG
ncbi:MAG TPA: hypothetical protein VET88_02140, partial [Gammaproteobacteria bacterium]|nr:hypothetical protein [Gammaproteobacteria bacterium]